MQFKLNSPFKPTGDQPAAIQELCESFIHGKKQQTLLGVTGSGKTFTMANIIQRIGKKTLILAPNKTLAAQLFAEFREFFPDNAVEFFVSYYDYYQPEAYVPGSDTYIEKDSAINEEIDKLRHSATRSLLEREDVIVVASVSCIYGIGSPDEYSSKKIELFNGQEIPRDTLLRELVDVQYTRNDMDFSRGTFRVRGDLVEIFPAHEDSKVVRVEFFGDDIDGLYLVDPLTGKVLQSLHKTVIYPKSHYVVGQERLKCALETIKIELRERLQDLQTNNKLVEHQRLSQRTLLDLEMLEEMGFCSGIENYSRHLTGARPGDPPPTLVDYFGKDFLMIIDESHITIPQVGGMFKGDRARKETLVEYGFRLPSALDNRPLNFQEFEKRMDHVLYVSATPGNYEIEHSGGEFVEQVIRPTGLLDPVIAVKPADHQVEDMLEEVKKVTATGGRILITTLTKKMAEELTSYYAGAGIRVRYLHSEIDSIERIKIIRSLRLGEFDVLVGINLLREGLDIPEVCLVGIMDADKEGFLRSTRSLIQTIGRAARNAQGRVILYAYKTTKSMQEAIDITEKRRIKQNKFNVENGITPLSVAKKISGGVIDLLGGDKKAGVGRRKGGQDFEAMSVDELDKKIELLSKDMLAASKELRFEDAASIRDEIRKLKEYRLIL